MTDVSLVNIGRVSGPHGIKGEFKVVPLTDFPERFKEMDVVKLYDATSGAFLRELKVSQVRNRPEKGHVLLQTKEIRYRDQAESLRGSMIKVSKEERMPLPEGEYWVDELVGFDIVDHSSGDKLGVLQEVLKTGASDLYAVKCEDEKIRHIPAVKEFVKHIDQEGKEIKVELIEGLWDL